MFKLLKNVSMLVLVAVMLVSAGGCENSKKGNSAEKVKLDLTMWSAQGTDYVTPKMPQNIEDRIPEKWLYDKTGVRVSNAFGNGGGSWESKLTMLVAGNNLPNLFHLAGGQGPAHFAKLASGNLLHEITPEMLKKYAPNVWKAIPQSMWDRIKVNGKIYGIPYDIPVDKEVTSDFTNHELDFITVPTSDVSFSPIFAMWIRDDVLKKIFPDAMDYNQVMKLLNEKKRPIGDELCDVPIKTTNDYIKFMRDIKNLGFKNGDKPVYAFGFNGGDNWVALSYFGSELMGYRGHQYPLTWNYKEQRLEMPLLGTTVKEAAKIQNRLIREEVIDPESLMHTNAQWKEKVLNGQYAIVPLGLADDVVYINKQLEDAGKSFRFRPFYTQMKNDDRYPAYKEPLIWAQSIALFNTIKKDDVPKVLQWIDTMFSDEYEEIVNWGTKDAGLYETTADGKRKFKDESYQKMYVDGITNAVDPTKNKLLQGVMGSYVIRKYNTSKFNPILMSGTKKYVLREKSGAKFTLDSPHTKNILKFPPCKMTSPEYSSIPEVQKFWASRSKWDDPFKLAFVAKSDSDFDTAWQNAVDNVYKIANVDEMLKQMTEIARPLAQKLDGN